MKLLQILIIPLLLVFAGPSLAEFDVNDPADLAALKAEFDNDPAALGYAAAAGDTSALLALFNDRSIAAAVTIPIEDLDIPDIANVIDPVEYGLLNEYDKQWVIQFINRPASETLAPYQAKFLSVFPGGSTTRTAAIALLNATGSRAEVLFGLGTVITRTDWIAARDGGV